MISFFYNLIKLIILIVLPFGLLLRGAMYFHVAYNLNTWACLLGATVLTALALFIYFSFFYGRITGKFGNFDAVKRRAWIALLAVLVYAAHGILFFKGQNLKSSELRSEVMELHPILRLSLSTLVYLDSELIVTDASRVKEDYKTMGLKTNNSSLHYKQNSTGYVHAVDIRTKGRSELVNLLIKGYFNLAGFNTLRHTGTADHLHVSMFSEDHPHSK